MRIQNFDARWGFLYIPPSRNFRANLVLANRADRYISPMPMRIQNFDARWGFLYPPPPRGGCACCVCLSSTAGVSQLSLECAFVSKKHLS